MFSVVVIFFLMYPYRLIVNPFWWGLNEVDDDFISIIWIPFLWTRVSLIIICLKACVVIVIYVFDYLMSWYQLANHFKNTYSEVYNMSMDINLLPIITIRGSYFDTENNGLNRFLALTSCQRAIVDDWAMDPSKDHSVGVPSIIIPISHTRHHFIKNSSKPS